MKALFASGDKCGSRATATAANFAKHRRALLDTMLTGDIRRSDKLEVLKCGLGRDDIILQLQTVGLEFLTSYRRTWNRGNWESQDEALDYVAFLACCNNIMGRAMQNVDTSVADQQAGSSEQLFAIEQATIRKQAKEFAQADGLVDKLICHKEVLTLVTRCQHANLRVNSKRFDDALSADSVRQTHASASAAGLETTREETTFSSAAVAGEESSSEGFQDEEVLSNLHVPQPWEPPTYTDAKCYPNACFRKDDDAVCAALRSLSMMFRAGSSYRQSYDSEESAVDRFILISAAGAALDQIVYSMKDDRDKLVLDNLASDKFLINLRSLWSREPCTFRTTYCASILEDYPTHEAIRSDEAREVLCVYGRSSKKDIQENERDHSRTNIDRRLHQSTWTPSVTDLSAMRILRSTERQWNGSWFTPKLEEGGAGHRKPCVARAKAHDGPEQCGDQGQRKRGRKRKREAPAPRVRKKKGWVRGHPLWPVWMTIDPRDSKGRFLPGAKERFERNLEDPETKRDMEEMLAITKMRRSRKQRAPQSDTRCRPMRMYLRQAQKACARKLCKTEVQEVQRRHALPAYACRRELRADARRCGSVARLVCACEQYEALFTTGQCSSYPGQQA